MDRIRGVNVCVGMMVRDGRWCQCVVVGDIDSTQRCGDAHDQRGRLARPRHTRAAIELAPAHETSDCAHRVVVLCNRPFGSSTLNVRSRGALS